MGWSWCELRIADIADVFSAACKWVRGCVYVCVCVFVVCCRGVCVDVCVVTVAVAGVLWFFFFEVRRGGGWHI